MPGTHALKFDGVNQMLTIPFDNDMMLVDNDTSSSIEFWIKRDTPCEELEIIFSRYDQTKNLAYVVGCEKNEIVHGFLDMSKPIDEQLQPIHYVNVFDNNWHHIAIDPFRNSTFSIYINAHSHERESWTFDHHHYDKLHSFYSSTNDMTIGGMEGIGKNFSGTLDELRIYPYTLDGDAITHRFLSGIPTPKTSDGCNSDLKIMPLGNLHTAGDSTMSPPVPGYRPYLYQSLTQSGYQVDFVGSQHDSSVADFDFDGDHQSHPLLYIHEIEANIDNYLTTNSPNIVLLSISHSDYDDDYDPWGENSSGPEGTDDTRKKIRNILDKIEKHDENIITILALQRGTQSNIHYYLERDALGWIAKGDNIMLVDMRDGNMSYRSNDTGFDTISPLTDASYKIIAKAFEQAILSTTPACQKRKPEFSSLTETSYEFIPFSGSEIKQFPLKQHFG